MPVSDPQKLIDRINLLKKTNPKSSEIGSLQRRLAKHRELQGQGAGPVLTPEPETPTSGPSYSGQYSGVNKPNVFGGEGGSSTPPGVPSGSLVLTPEPQPPTTGPSYTDQYSNINKPKFSTEVDTGGIPVGAPPVPGAQPQALPQSPLNTGEPSPVSQKIGDVRTGQRELANAGADLALQNLQATNLGSAFNPTLTDRPLTGQLEADRARIEEAVFGRLTRGLEDDYRRGREQAEQNLRNAGIPFSTNPDSQYQQRLGAFDKRFDDARLAARQTAIGIGGDEYQRAFGIGEQLRQNQLGEQSGIRNQQLSEVGNLSNVGLGGAISFEQLADADKDRILQEALAKLQAKTAKEVAQINNRPSGGGSPNADSPFNTGGAL